MTISKMIERLVGEPDCTLADAVALRVGLEEVKREAQDRVSRYGDN